VRIENESVFYINSLAAGVEVWFAIFSDHGHEVDSNLYPAH